MRHDTSTPCETTVIISIRVCWDTLPWQLSAMNECAAIKLMPLGSLETDIYRVSLFQSTIISVECACACASTNTVIRKKKINEHERTLTIKFGIVCCSSFLSLLLSSLPLFLVRDTCLVELEPSLKLVRKAHRFYATRTASLIH